MGIYHDMLSGVPQNTHIVGMLVLSRGPGHFLSSATNTQQPQHVLLFVSGDAVPWFEIG